ncbi:hypothetical protein [Brevundimonas denitrificans]|uniref:hypothetical protein n=1 Tax=Brevundimonas denitrificans TaxID=1443434 RepID=UPI00223ADDD4|nr:hypothetical protein [Brevundimonas denitrificans]
MIAGASANRKMTEPDPAADIVARTEALFDAIAALPEIAECGEAMAHANDRLRAVRRLEGYVIAGREAELASLYAAANEPDRLVSALEAYRDRRLAVVPDLMRLLMRPPAERPVIAAPEES